MHGAVRPHEEPQDSYRAMGHARGHGAGVGCWDTSKEPQNRCGAPRGAGGEPSNASGPEVCEPVKGRVVRGRTTGRVGS